MPILSGTLFISVFGTLYFIIYIFSNNDSSPLVFGIPFPIKSCCWRIKVSTAPLRDYGDKERSRGPCYLQLSNSTFAPKNALKPLLYLRFNNKNTLQSGKIEVSKTP